MIAIMFEEIEIFLVGAMRRERAFAPREALFQLGDSVRFIHFITTGLVHLVRHQPTGAPLVLQRAGPGAILAEASLYSDVYHCDARAAIETRTSVIPKKDLLERVRSDPAFAHAWTRRLALEVQRSRLQSEVTSMKTVAAKLDAWLAWHEHLPPRGEWAALAAEISVSPEALYREMAKRRR
jgi:CRP-like cAMP-binding protein